MWAGECAGAILVGWPEQQAIFNLLFLCWNWEQASLCACSSTAVSVSYSPLSGKPHWFSSQPRELIFPVLDPGLRSPIWDLNF